MMQSVLHSRFVRIAVFLMVVFVGGAGLYIWHWLHAPVKVFGQSVELERGESLYGITKKYPQVFAGNKARFWVLYARLSGLTDIKRGEYEMPPELSPAELLVLFNSGKVKQRTLTLVEGITLKQALQQIADNPLLAPSKLPINIDNFKSRFELDEINPEGWLFPDTYAYSKQTTGWDLIDQAHRKMKSVLAEEWSARSLELPYESAYEALIMASIVEKETGVPYERAEIAGVFVRRLQKPMRLQTDPTVIYGLGEAYQGDIKRKHLRQKTDYNTYVIKGLPPTPIALPGREAIHAALHPAEGTALFFVAKGDGSHQFSDTLAEHQAAVRKYQLQRRSDYRSSQLK